MASLAHQHRAATDIQRHVRGYNVRKLLEPGTRSAAVPHLSPAPAPAPAQVPPAERAEVPRAGQEGGGRQPAAGEHPQHGGGGGAGGDTSELRLVMMT